jgi:predicted DNA-binding transcriptional regulator YafY
MSRSTRLFEIIQILRAAPRPVTAQQIAETLEVTRRTVYRDIAALMAMRLPIHGEAGVGYVMRPGYDLPPLMFSGDELEAIVVGLAMLGRTRDRDLIRSAERAAAKIADVLPAHADPPSHLHVSDWSEVPETLVDIGTLRQFIRESMALEIVYDDKKASRTKRRVKPVALTYYVNSLVLAAWCDLREDFRHFRVDRIRECVPTGERFNDTSDTLRRCWAATTGLA